MVGKGRQRSWSTAGDGRVTWARLIRECISHETVSVDATRLVVRRRADGARGGSAALAEHALVCRQQVAADSSAGDHGADRLLELV